MDELDYTKEAEAGTRFSEAMRKRGLDRVLAAEVVPELTTRRVLTTAWVEGRRIDDPALTVEVVEQSVQLAVAAYLTMLLDTGSLHADPHPGNLLITADGKLCILDFGLVTPVTRAQQYAILQYVAHLVGKDFAAIAGDLVAMGFVPEYKKQALEDSGVVEVLAEVFRALAKGGGVKTVSNNLSQIGKEDAAAAAAEEPPLTSTGLPRERTTKARGVAETKRTHEQHPETAGSRAEALSSSAPDDRTHSRVPLTRWAPWPRISRISSASMTTSSRSRPTSRTSSAPSGESASLFDSSPPSLSVKAHRQRADATCCGASPFHDAEDSPCVLLLRVSLLSAACWRGLGCLLTRSTALRPPATLTSPAGEQTFPHYSHN